MHSQGFLHHFAHDFDRTFEIEALTWTHVQLKRNGIQFFLAMYRQVSALGQVLADQAINVFVAAALPRAVRVTEVDRHTGSLGDLGVLCHFPALVVGHALAHRQRHVIEGGAEALHCRGRRRVVHLHQHQVATSALHQRTYRRGVSLTLNKVAFPMPRHQSVFNFRRAQVNTDHLWNLPAPIHTAKAWSTCRLALAQTKDQLLAQLTDGQGIDRVVDRLATDVGISKTGYVHTAQLAGNLLGRQTLAQHMDHQFKALTTWQQLSHGPTSLAADLHPLLSHAGRVAASCISIAAHLSADRRRGSVDQAGNPAQAEALGMTNLNGGTLFNAEFGIRHRAAPYRKGQVLHSVFAAALFTPASLDNLTVSHHYTQAWQALKRWPHGFHLLLSQYIDNPMSERGQSGINKHFRDIHEKLYRQRENKGIARLRAAFDQFIEINWPNAIQTHRLTRISLSSDERPLITQKEAQRLLDCREPRIHSLIAQGKITLHKFKGKAYFNREEIESLARLYQDNWSMEQAVIETELSRYQLKQLLDAGLVKALQRADSQNRDWLICKRSWQRMIRNFKKFATDDAKPKGKSLSGIQKQGFTISETLNLILNHKVTYRFTPEPSKPYSLKQLSDFRSKKTSSQEIS